MLCDEVGTLDWGIALQQLLDLINDTAKKAGKQLSTLIQRPAMDCCFAQLHQGLFANFIPRKLRY